MSCDIVEHVGAPTASAVSVPFDPEVEYEAAKAITLASLPDYIAQCIIRHAPTDIDAETFGACMTTCVALAAASVTATQHKLKPLRRWGIIGSFVRAWDGTEGPIRITRWESMLDAGSSKAFANIIPANAVAFLKIRAKQMIMDLAESATVSSAQKTQWKNIAAGQFPFGYKEDI